MIYLHVMHRGALGVKSPMDRLWRGYARAARVSTEPPSLLPGWKAKGMKPLRVSGLKGSRK